MQRGDITTAQTGNEMHEITHWSYTEGSSDKVYILEIAPEGHGWTVMGRSGRRGASLVNQPKTKNGPVAYSVARSLYDAEVRTRQRKRYQLDKTVNPTTPIAPASAAAAAPVAPRPVPVTPLAPARVDTGLRAMLLKPVDGDAHIRALMADDRYGLERKHDGRRVMLIVHTDFDGAYVRGANRNGEEFEVPHEVRQAAKLTAMGRAVLDGEMVGTQFHPFDLLEVEGRCIRKQPYAARRARLATLLGDGSGFELTATHTGSDKDAARAAYLADGAEGVVFKRLDAPYSPGRGEDAFKWKFVASATVLVAARNAKRSIVAAVVDDAGAELRVGNVTIPPNHEVPPVGAYVEVEYLYCFPGEDGCLYQPVYKGQRDDKTEADTHASLQFKDAERKAA